MNTAIEASTVDAMTPNAGTPDADRRLKRSGKRPSLAAASGISAQIMVQPLRAPNPEMMTASAITLPAQLPPKMTLAAVEKGAGALTSVEVGTMPKTAVSDSMYTTAVASVPRIVERGMLRSGSRTLPAGTAAGSTPRERKRAIAIPPPTAAMVLSPLTFQGW